MREMPQVTDISESDRLYKGSESSRASGSLILFISTLSRGAIALTIISTNADMRLSDCSCIVAMENNGICVVLESPHGAERQIQRYAVGVLSAGSEGSCALEFSRICGCAQIVCIVLVGDNWRSTSLR